LTEAVEPKKVHRIRHLIAAAFGIGRFDVEVGRPADVAGILLRSLE
jgi:hypothetical protein